MVTRRAIIVHSLEDARAALAAAAELGLPVTLRSAPGAAAYLGAQIFREIIETARAEYPEVDAVGILDCGENAGFALAALRHGIERVRVDLPAETRARVADIARQHGGALDDDPAPALDLLDCDSAAERCRNWLREPHN
jgi:fructose/tagatose bisphosphate aldolase